VIISNRVGSRFGQILPNFGKMLGEKSDKITLITWMGFLSEDEVNFFWAVVLTFLVFLSIFATD